LQQTANLIGMPFRAPFLLQGAVQATDEAIEASAPAYLQHITSPDLDAHARLRRLLAEMAAAGTELKA
jgi:hypothetical protein